MNGPIQHHDCLQGETDRNGCAITSICMINCIKTTKTCKI